jgi:hypothetical protein
MALAISFSLKFSLLFQLIRMMMMAMEVVSLSLNILNLMCITMTMKIPCLPLPDILFIMHGEYNIREN